MTTDQKVIVAMSGGVDSSVAAYLLKNDGYDVIGVHLRLWFDEDADQGPRPDDAKRCCALSNAEDARRIAETLDIPFYVLNCRDEFQRDVVNYFCEEYFAGRTPNPCIVCNERIKFGYLLNKADELGVKYVATGHYTRVERNNDSNRFDLKKGVDSRKEQSYFLFSLSQDQLSRALFPLGTYIKDNVRSIAKEAGLKTHSKAESQEICFITNNNYREFLHRRYPEKFASGDIVNTSGKVIGSHQGIFAYTIGQRKGIGISNPIALYVIRIDPGKNEIIVGEDNDLIRPTLEVERLNWVAIDKLTEPLRCSVMIRYNHPGTPSTIEPLENDRVSVRFNEPQRAITPGQAAVFYDNDRVIGGGWIGGDQFKIKN